MRFISHARSDTKYQINESGLLSVSSSLPLQASHFIKLFVSHIRFLYHKVAHVINLIPQRKQWPLLEKSLRLWL